MTRTLYLPRRERASLQDSTGTRLAFIVGGLIIAIMSAAYLLATPAGRQCSTDIDCLTHCGTK